MQTECLPCFCRNGKPDLPCTFDVDGTTSGTGNYVSLGGVLIFKPQYDTPSATLTWSINNGNSSNGCITFSKVTKPVKVAQTYVRDQFMCTLTSTRDGSFRDDTASFRTAKGKVNSLSFGRK